MKSRKITCYNKEFIKSYVGLLTTASPPGERQHPEHTPVSNRYRPYWWKFEWHSCDSELSIWCISPPVNPPNSLIRQNWTDRIHSHVKTAR